MKTRLLIARHGNTFGPGDVVLRVGAGTDIPLVARGREQGAELGRYLAAARLIPDVVFCGALRRAKETAQCAIEAMGVKIQLIEDKAFNEIDYGPDEGKPEEEVVARLGKETLEAWDESAQVPPGWNVSPQALIAQWNAFGERMAQEFAGQTILVVTSNGVARFAPYLTGDFEAFRANHSLKLSTGALGCFTHSTQDMWDAEAWNVRPDKWLAQQAS